MPKATTRAAGRATGAPFARTAPLLLVAVAALLSGCANRDSIQVGSIPDDYRTRHPIVVGEKAQTLDLPVAAGDREVTPMQKVAFEGFLDRYDRAAAPVLTILVPAGSYNQAAANDVGRGLVRLAGRNGVPSQRIMLTRYQADASERTAPIRVTYSAMRAYTGRCGRWPEDIADTSENKQWENFGCSYQNNLAAQVSNPADLLGPRRQTEIDPENRSKVIDVYRARKISEEFKSNSEVDYTF